MTKHNSILNLDTAERMEIGTYLLEQINDYMTNTRGVRVSVGGIPIKPVTPLAW